MADIGRFCSIANDVKIIYGRHPQNEFISSHPAFFSNKKQAVFTFSNIDFFKEQNLLSNGKSCAIDSDVWIGEGAIIGACTLVTKDVKVFSIILGVPAKK